MSNDSMPREQQGEGTQHHLEFSSHHYLHACLRETGELAADHVRHTSKHTSQLVLMTDTSTTVRFCHMGSQRGCRGVERVLQQCHKQLHRQRARNRCQTCVFIMNGTGHTHVEVSLGHLIHFAQPPLNPLPIYGITPEQLQVQRIMPTTNNTEQSFQETLSIAELAWPRHGALLVKCAVQC
jgi:hypothetical protein